MQQEAVVEEIFEGIKAGDRARVVEKVQGALSEGLSAEVILQDGMIAAMRHVGNLFEEGVYFVPEMLISARAMQGGLEVLKPHLVSSNFQAKGIIIAGTVKGDLHDIGKNLVCMLLQGAGYEVIDLGTDVSAAHFVETAQKENADVIAVSALLTTTMSNMKAVIEAVGAAGLNPRVKVIVGGAPITEAFAEQIGADGYAPDASRAVNVVSSLLNPGS